MSPSRWVADGVKSSATHALGHTEGASEETLVPQLFTASVPDPRTVQAPPRPCSLAALFSCFDHHSYLPSPRPATTQLAKK